jgi:DNA repair exonuclease SbcCD ATPase subunit
MEQDKQAEKEQEPRRFPTDFSAIGPEDGKSGFEGEMLRERMEKLESRLTLVAVLVLCMILALGFFFYFSFDKRILAVSTAGAGRMALLSQELEQNVGVLSRRVKEAEETLGQKIVAVEKASESAKELLQQTEPRLAALETGKADRDELLKEIKQLQEANEALAGSLAGFSQWRSTADNRIQEVSAIAQTAQGTAVSAQRALADLLEWQITIMEGFGRMEAKILALEQSKLDMNSLEKALEQSRSTYSSRLATVQQEMNQRAASVESQIVTLQSEMENLREAANRPDPNAPKPGPATIRETPLFP